jgi:2-octaprenyl-6-methoxyphenol hydroxylase
VRDVAALAELVIDRRRLGLDIGDDALLRRYEQWRRFDAFVLAAVTDRLSRLFRTGSRRCGRPAISASPPSTGWCRSSGF